MIRIRTHVFPYPPPRAVRAVSQPAPQSGHNRYTAREDAVIAREYYRIGAENVAERLGRSPDAVRERWLQLRTMGAA